MNPKLEKHKIIKSSDTFSIIKENTVTNVVDLDNNKELISYLDDDNKNDENINSFSLNISISVAASITALARLYIYNFKNFIITFKSYF